MGVILKQSLISTILTYLGVVIGFVNFLYLFPAYMSPVEVGLVRTLQDTSILMVPFVQLGISQLIIKYYPIFKNKKYYAEFIILVLALFLLSSILFSILFFIFKNNLISYFEDKSSLANQYLLYIFGLALLLAFHQILVSFAQSLQNITLPNFLKEVVLRVLTFLAIILFAIKIITFHQFIFLLVCFYLLSFFLLLAYLLKQKIFQFKGRFKYLTWAKIKPMVSYSLFTFLGASGILIIGKIDSVMITGMLGLDATAIYTTAFYIAVLIELPKRAVAQISIPIISRAFKNNNQEEIKTIYTKSAINNLIIGSLLFIGIWVNLDNLYSLIPNPETYVLGKWVVLIIGLGKLSDMLFGLNGEIIIMSKHYRVNVHLIIFLTFFTVAANYILIPIYGLEGAAIGSTLALFFFNLSKFIFLYWKENIQPFSFQTIKVIVIAAISLLAGLSAPLITNLFIDIIYRSILVTILFGGMVIWLKPSKDINELLKKTIKKLNF